MYADMRDFEPEYTTEIDGLTVEVEKVGGGTVGREYDGRWAYRISQDGVPVIFGNDLWTGIPKTHAQTAGIIYELSGLADEEACGGPLDDFGAPNAGATEIRYTGHPEMNI